MWTAVWAHPGPIDHGKGGDPKIQVKTIPKEISDQFDDLNPLICGPQVQRFYIEKIF